MDVCWSQDHSGREARAGVYEADCLRASVAVKRHETMATLIKEDIELGLAYGSEV